jgi:hypothetical protein
MNIIGNDIINNIIELSSYIHFDNYLKLRLVNKKIYNIINESINFHYYYNFKLILFHISQNKEQKVKNLIETAKLNKIKIYKKQLIIHIQNLKINNNSLLNYVLNLIIFNKYKHFCNNLSKIKEYYGNHNLNDTSILKYIIKFMESNNIDYHNVLLYDDYIKIKFYCSILLCNKKEFIKYFDILSSNKIYQITKLKIIFIYQNSGIMQFILENILSNNFILKCNYNKILKNYNNLNIIKYLQKYEENNLDDFYSFHKLQYNKNLDIFKYYINLYSKYYYKNEIFNLHIFEHIIKKIIKKNIKNDNLYLGNIKEMIKNEYNIFSDVNMDNDEIFENEKICKIIKILKLLNIF